MIDQFFEVGRGIRVPHQVFHDGLRTYEMDRLAGNRADAQRQFLIRNVGGDGAQRFAQQAVQRDADLLGNDVGGDGAGAELP